MANICIGMTIVGVPALIFIIWQYKRYVATIRYVSDRWKGLHDELAARHSDLYDRWMTGIQPSGQEIMAYDTKRMIRMTSEMEYGAQSRSNSNG